MADFKTFMSLTDASVAEEFASILETNKIPFRIQDTSKDFDASFSNNKATQSIIIMLDPKDFDKATAVLDIAIEFEINDIDKNHPMFTFDRGELIDVIKNNDEWHPLDVKLAQYLLDKQQITIDNDEISRYKKIKLIDSSKPEIPNPITILTGYAFCMIGGLIGIAIALFLITARKTAADGSKYYVYSKTERNHGYVMLILGTIVFSLIIKLKFFS